MENTKSTSASGVEKLYDYHARLEWYNEKLAQQVQTYGDLIETIAALERDVKSACMDYMRANPDLKKVALEKIEMMSASEDEAKENYLHLVYLRHKRHILEKVISATESGLSAVQSAMKYDSPRY